MSVISEGLEQVSATKLQRKKWHKFNIIPCALLQHWHEQGFLPGDEPPRTGMNLYYLLSYLKGDFDYLPKKKRPKPVLYRNQEHRDRGEWLFNSLVNQEIVSRGRPHKVKSITFMDLYSASLATAIIV